MLKNTAEVLHKLNWLNDKQIAFTEPCFQTFSGKFLTVV